MPIFQFNLWICELCKTMKLGFQEVSQYDDPIVKSPDGEEWGYIGKEEKFVCPDCLKKN